MKRKTALLVPLFALLLGCQAGSSPAAPSPSAISGDGVEGLVAGLEGAGVAAKVGGTFSGELIGGEGVSVCIGKESVQVYEFIDNEAALAASSKIDRKDPWHVGNAVVEWIGTPRFWLRDRMIILYLGGDAVTDAALRTLLGQPFAEGPAGGGRPPLHAPDCR